MALRFLLALTLSLIFPGSWGVLAADWQQCSPMSRVAMDQTFPPGPPIGPVGPMPRTMDQTYPPGGPSGPTGPMAQTIRMRTCDRCGISWGPFPWGAYGMCEGGTRTCWTCRTVTIDGKRSELCEIETEPCGSCTRTTTTTW
jgi:hypothetical protein